MPPVPTDRLLTLLATTLCLAAVASAQNSPAPSSISGDSGANLAVVAKSFTSYVSGHETITALNNGYDPKHSNDKSHGAYGNWPRTGTQWVQYEWSHPVSVARMDIYWFDDHGGVRLPKACRVKYWDGSSFASGIYFYTLSAGDFSESKKMILLK